VSRRFVPALLGTLLLVAGCELLEEKPSTSLDVRFTFKIKATDEGGRGVAGTQINLGKATKGETDASGFASVTLSGQPGKVAPLTIKCPVGFASPEKTLNVTLTQLASGSPVPVFETRCTALMRSVVVGIRTENGPGLPIIYLGKEIGRTDASGAAHVVLNLPPDETASLLLDTSNAPALRPQNPSIVFKVGRRDELLLLEQKFVVFQRRIATKAVSRPTPL
jgi:hypothetical protein